MIKNSKNSYLLEKPNFKALLDTAVIELSCATVNR